MQYINEFRLVGVLSSIGKLFTYPDGSQVLVCHIETCIDGVSMNHSINFYDSLAHDVLNSARIGQPINVDGSLMAIEHIKDNKPQTYFGLKARSFYLITLVQQNKHYNSSEIPPIQTPSENRHQPRTYQNQKKSTSSQQRPNPQQVRHTPSNTQQRHTPQQHPNQAANNAQQQTNTHAQHGANTQQQVDKMNSVHWTESLDFSNGAETSPHIELVGQSTIQKKNEEGLVMIQNIPIDTTLPFIKP